MEINIEIKYQKFHQHKRPISVKNMDTDEIAVSSNVSFGKKDLIVIRMLKN